MKDNDTIYMECDCGSNDHIFKLTYSEGDKTWPPHVFTSMQLSQCRPWYERVWLAVKYVFGAESRFGHWDCTSLDYNKLKLLRNWTEQCVIQMEENPAIKKMLKLDH